MPRAAQASVRKARTAGVSRTGQECLPILATASASSVTALSEFSIEPWPARPRAVSRIQAMPFSATWIRYMRWPPIVALKPPTSPIASVTPSKRPGWLSTSQRAP